MTNPGEIKGRLGYKLKEEFPDKVFRWFKDGIYVSFRCCLLPPTHGSYTPKKCPTKIRTGIYPDIAQAVQSVREHKCTPYKKSVDIRKMQRVLNEMGLSWEDLDGGVSLQACVPTRQGCKVATPGGMDIGPPAVQQDGEATDLMTRIQGRRAAKKLGVSL